MAFEEELNTMLVRFFFNRLVVSFLFIHLTNRTIWIDVLGHLQLYGYCMVGLYLLVRF